MLPRAVVHHGAARAAPPEEEESRHEEEEERGPAEKGGWLRRFCGRGLFREIWRSRYVTLRGEHLLISDKEVRAERRPGEVLDLVLYDRSEEIRRPRSRSKKDLSRFTLIHCPTSAPTVPNLVFLAVSPEEKESWVNHLNAAIIRAKNHTLDQVTVEEDGGLIHPTRDRVRIPHSRRPPSRAHLLTIIMGCNFQAMLTLDLVEEEDFRVDLEPGPGGQEVKGRQRSCTDASHLRLSSRETRVTTGSLPRGSERSWGKQCPEAPPTTRTQLAQCRSRCASMDQVLSSRPARMRSEFRAQGGGQGGAPLQSLIAQKMQRAQELLEEMRLQFPLTDRSPRSRSSDSPRLRGKEARSRGGRESPRSKARRNHSPCLPSSPLLPSSPRLAPSSTRLPSSPCLPSSYSPQPNTPVLAKQSTSSLLLGPEDLDSPPLSNCKASPTSSLSSKASMISCTSPPLSPPSLRSKEEHEQEQSEECEVACQRAEAVRLLQEAVCSWKEAQEVLQEVRELQSQTLRRQRRRTYEKMASLPTATTASPPGDAAEGEDSVTLQVEEDQSETN
ncbi:unnamed protein product [Merluccius merluccius]